MRIDLSKIQAGQGQADFKEDGQKSFLAELLAKDIHLFGNNLKDKKKEAFYSELGILLSSGIDIRTALNIIIDEQKKPVDKALFQQITDKVVKGESLSEAVWQSSKFSTYEYYSLKIGEESGRLYDVLKDIAGFYNKKIKQKRQLTSAFTYPSLVLVTAIAAVYFMMNYIVPMFVDVFKRFKGELPAITQMIMNASSFFSHYSGYMLLCMLAILAAIFAIRKKIWYRKIASKLLMKMPLFGDIVQKIYLSRYSQSMALLIGSKTPMIQTLQLVRKMIKFYPYERALGIIEQDIMHGKSLFESMQQFSFFDKRIVSLVKVGEEVNQLEKIFQQLNEQYTEELEHKISMMSNLLEPVMIIFVGVLVAVILIAMYLPLFQLSTSIY